MKEDVHSTSTAQTEVLESKQVPTRQKVKEYFEDTPALYSVARCESHWQQYEKDGSVMRGNIDPADVGVMQINERYHLQRSRKLGYDIHTLKGNMDYAKQLYEEKGLQPWSASKHCWANQRVAKK